MVDATVVILSSFSMMYEPLVLHHGELLTYILLPIITIMQKYTIWRSYECGINFALFILIQGAIVVGTFWVDVEIFDRQYTVWNIIGGVLVVLSAALSSIYYTQ